MHPFHKPGGETEEEETHNSSLAIHLLKEEGPKREETKKRRGKKCESEKDPHNWKWKRAHFPPRAPHPPLFAIT